MSANSNVEACGKRRFMELGDAGAGQGSEAHWTPVMDRRHARKLRAGTRKIKRNLRKGVYSSLHSQEELEGSGRGQCLEAHERPAKRLRAGTRNIRRNLRKGVYSSVEAGGALPSDSALREDVVVDVRTRQLAVRALFSCCNDTSESVELAATIKHSGSTADLRRTRKEIWAVKATSLELHTHKLIPRQVRRSASQRSNSAMPPCFAFPAHLTTPLQTQRTMGGRAGSLLVLPHLLVGASCIPNGGLGVYAATSMAKGTWLTEYGGEVINVQEARQRRDCG